MAGIEKKFQELKIRKRTALIPYFMLDYPNRAAFLEILAAAREAGADLIEVGIPFSDPIADGPVIRNAGWSALKQGASLCGAFELLQGRSDLSSLPLVLMTYFNPVLRFGQEEFFYHAHAVGISGVVFPDLGLEESSRVSEQARRFEVDIIQFVTPTTPSSRIVEISDRARGFIYLISLTGVTGARPGHCFDVETLAGCVKAETSLPVCVGFGISKPMQAAEAARFSDGVIIGSALVELIDSGSAETASRRVFDYLYEMRRCLSPREI